MYYKFEYQNDEYLINLDKIEYIIKSSEYSNRVLIGLSNKILEFSFNNKEELEKFYDDLQCAIIEQEKVLEIIKEKKVNIDLLYASSSVEQYNDELVRVYGMWFVKDRQLTQDEFDLLKRWLNE